MIGRAWLWPVLVAVGLGSITVVGIFVEHYSEIDAGKVLLVPTAAGALLAAWFALEQVRATRDTTRQQLAPWLTGEEPHWVGDSAVVWVYNHGGGLARAVTSDACAYSAAQAPPLDDSAVDDATYQQLAAASAVRGPGGILSALGSGFEQEMIISAWDDLTVVAGQPVVMFVRFQYRTLDGERRTNVSGPVAFLVPAAKPAPAAFQARRRSP